MKDSSKNPLNLINVAGVFYILIIGLILSILVVTLELMYKAKNLAKKDQVTNSNIISKWKNQ